MPVVTGPRRTSPYRTVLRPPGAAGFFFAAAVARLGLAMTGLGIVWLVHWRTGSYGSAGVVTGGFAVAEAVVCPQIARLIDRFGQTRVLPPCLVAHGAAVGLLIGAVVGHCPLWLMVLAGIAAGSTVPQIGALSAARWSALLDGDPLLSAAFTLESTGNEVAFLAGPTLVAVVSVFIHPVAGTALAAVLTVGAGLAFARQRATAPVVSPAPETGRSSVFRQRGFGVLVAVNLGMGLFFGARQVSVTAFAVDSGHADLAGALYSVMGVASILAGLVYGMRRWGWSLPTQLAVALTTLTMGGIPSLLAANLGLMVGALALSGVAIAPVLILSTTLTESLVDRSALTQAFTWLNSAAAAGSATAAALAGQAIDRLNVHWGFAITLVAAAGAATAAIFGRSALRRDRISDRKII